jgi:hypothetical protein
MKKYFLAPALLLLLSFCFEQIRTMNGAEAESGIEGVILMGPTHGGPLREGTPDSKPLANIKFNVQREGEEKPVTSFTTDGEGKFRVAVPAGKYSVIRDGGKRGIGNYGPFEIEVAAGKMSSVQWHCDSGMR